jgi:predicted DsbA family dithiol-disulfide isomerase
MARPPQALTIVNPTASKRNVAVLVEIWSDVVCPWCAIGRQRFLTALDGFAHRDEVEVVFRSFELDPGAPDHREGSAAEHVARKYGMSVDEARRSQDHLEEVAAVDGVELHFERTRSGNTFDAHRLLHLARERGLQHELKAALMHGFFAEGLAVGDPIELAAVAVSVGLDATEVAEVLEGNRYADEVRSDEERARSYEITGVPFFLIDGRFAIPGAQPVERFALGLDRAWERSTVASGTNGVRG